MDTLGTRIHMAAMSCAQLACSSHSATPEWKERLLEVNLLLTNAPPPTQGRPTFTSQLIRHGGD